MTKTDLAVRLRPLVLLAMWSVTGGCGLKDDLYIPVEEPEAADTEEPEEESAQTPERTP